VKTAFPLSATGGGHSSPLHADLHFASVFLSCHALVFISRSVSFRLASSRFRVRSAPLLQVGPQGLWVNPPSAGALGIPLVLYLLFIPYLLDRYIIGLVFFWIPFLFFKRKGIKYQP